MFSSTRSDPPLDFQSPKIETLFFFNNPIESFSFKNELFFRGTDVCRVLEFSNSFRDIEKYAHGRHQEFKLFEGKPVIYLTLTGLFRMILKSKAMYAVHFQDWICDAVLPSVFFPDEYPIEKLKEKDNLPELLKSLLPNTDPLTIQALQKRDADINNLYDFEFVHKVLPYSSRNNKGVINAILLPCSKFLIYGHDYWYNTNSDQWELTHIALEYLLSFARPKSPINLHYFGNSHVVLNLVRFLESINFPQPANSYAPKIVMEPSALMKSGKTFDWYPISKEGLILFSKLWNNSDLIIWNEIRQILSSLNTYRYVKSINLKNSKNFAIYLFNQFLEENNLKIKDHPQTNKLCTLISVNESKLITPSL